MHRPGGEPPKPVRPGGIPSLRPLNLRADSAQAEVPVLGTQTRDPDRVEHRRERAPPFVPQANLRGGRLHGGGPEEVPQEIPVLRADPSGHETGQGDLQGPRKPHLQELLQALLQQERLLAGGEDPAQHLPGPKRRPPDPLLPLELPLQALPLSLPRKGREGPGLEEDPSEDPSRKNPLHRDDLPGGTAHFQDEAPVLPPVGPVGPGAAGPPEKPPVLPEKRQKLPPQKLLPGNPQESLRLPVPPEDLPLEGHPQGSREALRQGAQKLRPPGGRFLPPGGVLRRGGGGGPFPGRPLLSGEGDHSAGRKQAPGLPGPGWQIW